MQGKLEIKDRKLFIEAPFDQDHADVFIMGLLEKAKCLVMEFMIRDQFEKKQKKEMGGIIKAGGIVH